MHDAFGVEVPDGKDDLNCVELDSRLRQALLGFEDFVELAAPDEGHDEVEAGLSLEKILHAHEERVVAAEEDVFLKFCVLNLLEVEEDIFADRLDSVLLVRWVIRPLRQEDFAEGSLAEKSLLLEVFEPSCVVLAVSDHDGLAWESLRVALIWIVNAARDLLWALVNKHLLLLQELLIHVRLGRKLGLGVALGVRSLLFELLISLFLTRDFPIE